METATPVKRDIEKLRINGQRLWDSLMELAQALAPRPRAACAA